METEHDHDAVYAEKAQISDFKSDAIEAENAEHNMTVLQAVKAYPMASFWAFVISCTIVGCPFSSTAIGEQQQLIPFRSWSPTMSSLSETLSP